MYRTTKLLVLPVALASLAVWSAAAAQAPASTNAPVAAKPALKTTDLFPDTVVAKGKGIEIKRSQLEEEVTRFKSQMAGRGQAAGGADNTMIERHILNQLIQVKLLNSKATDADKTAAKAQAEKRFAEAESKLGAEELNRELKLLSTTREDLITKWTELGAADAVAKRELKVNVSDAEVKQYFDDNQSKFEQPETVVASHILLATQDMATREELSADKKAAKHKQAEELLKRARAGEDFAKLAKENSEDPGSNKRGGQYQFPRGQMMKEFEDAAFSLNTNQVSDIVTTSYGYHIIKLSEKIPARKAGMDDEVVVTPGGFIALKQCWRDSEAATNAVKVSTLIRQKLEGEQFQKAMPDFMEKLRKDSGLEIVDEKLKPDTASEAPGRSSTEPTDKPKSK